MKIAIIAASLACLFLLNGCADNSLITDEEYQKNKGPAPYSPDFTSVLPEYQNQPQNQPR